MGRGLRFASCAALAALLVGAAAAADEGVKFPSVDWTGAVRVEVSARLYKPAGEGRFPAVVVLHGCGGLRSSGGQWGEWLAANGFVALVLDSFQPRGITNVCRRPAGRETFELIISLIEDAFSAAAYLAAQPIVDSNRIAAMGFSFGGNVVRRLGGEDARSYAIKSAPQFKALLPFYPGGCGISGIPGRDVRRIVVPMLILHAASDDWTPVDPCREAVEAARRRGEPVEIIVYPDAHHGFDQVDRPVTFLADVPSSGPERRMGVHIGGNREARDLARRDALHFLRKALPAERGQ